MKVVAVTACPAGLMHTFMAEKSIINEAKRRNIEIHVETQSASGIENKLDQKDINEADFVILAIDTAITGLERFDEKYTVKISTSDALKKIKKIFDQCIESI